jgi:uncharacterized Zn finger protein (UPF0148 family)
MSIKFECPNCKTMLQSGDGTAGKTGTCPDCKKDVIVPTKDTESKNVEEKKAQEGNRSANN